eukprot:NODE_182_length_13754_cov_0.678067.p7 type:complete len:268 gc:universal NODE_182_length_13754_cov_0.678067:13511-12708(-)
MRSHGIQMILHSLLFAIPFVKPSLQRHPKVRRIKESPLDLLNAQGPMAQQLHPSILEGILLLKQGALNIDKLESIPEGDETAEEQVTLELFGDQDVLSTLTTYYDGELSPDFLAAQKQYYEKLQSQTTRQRTIATAKLFVKGLRYLLKLPGNVISSLVEYMMKKPIWKSFSNLVSTHSNNVVDTPIKPDAFHEMGDAVANVGKDGHSEGTGVNEQPDFPITDPKYTPPADPAISIDGIDGIDGEAGGERGGSDSGFTEAEPRFRFIK